MKTYKTKRNDSVSERKLRTRDNKFEIEKKMGKMRDKWYGNIGGKSKHICCFHNEEALTIFLSLFKPWQDIK